MESALRVALVGAGMIADKHLAAYRRFPDLLHLAAVCDIRAQAAQRLAAQAGVTAVYDDAGRMLREAQIDAVDICTPNDQHAPLAIAAAEAGKHILVEKPMAISADEARAMIVAAEKAGVKLMVNNVHLFKPNYRAAHRAIRDGELGEIRAVRMDAMFNVLAAVAADHWALDPRRAGGGAVLALATHRIDLSRWLVGEITRVSAVCRTINTVFRGMEDYASAILEFDNGAIGELFVSYSAAAAPWGEMLMILGTRGTIHAALRSASSNEPALKGIHPEKGDIHLFPRGQGDSHAFLPLQPDRRELPTDDMYINSLVHFAECCRSGTEPLTSGRDALASLRVIFAIYESARNGHAVSL